jgi:DNA invertase Pin-like site-specific DNA recombinase
MNKAPMRAVGYVRVSTNGQDATGFSLDQQIESIKKFCADNKIEMVNHYVETESAATITARPAFKNALRHVYNDPGVQYLVITNLDRHSRSVFDSEIIKRGLSKRGKKLISVQEQYLTPVRSVDPEFEEYLESALQHRMVEAEQERKRTRRRSLRGKKAKQEKGGWIGFRVPYEYDVVQGDIIVNCERSRLIRHMRRLRFWLQWSHQRIADYLNGTNKRGQIYPPPHARPSLRQRQRPNVYGTGRWTRNSVYHILRPGRGWDDRKGMVTAS